MSGGTDREFTHTKKKKEGIRMIYKGKHFNFKEYMTAVERLLNSNTYWGVHDTSGKLINLVKNPDMDSVMEEIEVLRKEQAK